MANIFTLENVADFSEKLNIDELYERKRQHDLNQLALYNKLLSLLYIIRTITMLMLMLALTTGNLLEQEQCRTADSRLELLVLSIKKARN
jgi:hypothetical protein